MQRSGRILAYVLAGIPAAVGVVFVSRYAYVTSDTADAALASAVLYGVTAAGAFGGPAAAIAIANAGRKGWAVAFGVLSLLAIVANWTNTLGGIAHRNAGTVAQSAKAQSDEADARRELARLEKALASIGQFTPADDASVAAAERAVTSAERTRKAECDKRGSNCRAREQDEQKAREALALATTNKATTDRAATLEKAATAERAKIGKRPAAPTTNSLGETLSRILPLDAAAAATAQQALMSAIVELIIAATLALPELLRPKHPARREEEAPAAEPTPEAVTARPAPTSAHAASFGNVPAFMLACLPKARGASVPLQTIYARYQRWCTEQQPAADALEAEAFAKQFRALCDRLSIRSETKNGKWVCVGVKIAA